MKLETMHRVIGIVVCLTGIASAFVCFFVMIGSGFFFGDIDDGEIEAAAASSRAMGLSFIAFGALSASVLVALLSGHIAKHLVTLVRRSDS